MSAPIKLIIAGFCLLATAYNIRGEFRSPISPICVLHSPCVAAWSARAARGFSLSAFINTFEYKHLLFSFVCECQLGLPTCNYIWGSKVVALFLNHQPRISGVLSAWLHLWNEWKVSLVSFLSLFMHILLFVVLLILWPTFMSFLRCL